MTVEPWVINLAVASVGAIGSFFANRNSGKAVEKIDTVHVMINSQLHEWVKSAVAEALATGKAQGIEQERNFQKGGVPITANDPKMIDPPIKP